jgi:hypothetical protein
MKRLAGKEKEEIIQDALKAREELAKSMVEPIRRAMDYQGIGRKLFGPQSLPYGVIDESFLYPPLLQKTVEGEWVFIPAYGSNEQKIGDILRKIQRIKQSL